VWGVWGAAIGAAIGVWEREGVGCGGKREKRIEKRE